MASTKELLNEEEKEVLFSRVKELDLVEAEAEVKCSRCRKLLIRHYTANCGHSFCPNCTRLVNDGSQRWRCDTCGQFIKNIEMQDVDLELKVSATSAYCPNRKYGCDFFGKLKQVSHHLKVCKDTKEMNLPVELKREESVPNRIFEVLDSLSERMVKVERKIENLEKKLGTSEKEHLRDTQAVEDTKVLEELNGRLKRLEVETEVGKHRRVREELERSEMEQKMKNLESEIEHLRRTELKMAKVVVRLGREEDQWSLVKEYLDLEDWSRKSQEAHSVLTWRVDRVRKKEEAENAKEMSSPTFDLPGFNLKAQAHIKINYFTGSILLSLSLTDHHPPSTRVPPRFLCFFKDQSGNGEDYVKAAIVPSKEPSRATGSTYACRLSAIPLLHPPICANDSLLIEVRVEPAHLPEVSSDGVLFDRISNYKKKRQLARKYIGCSLVSRFFSTADGRRMHVKMEMDEEGRLKAEVERLERGLPGPVVIHRAIVTVFNPGSGEKMVVSGGQGFDAWTMDIGSAEGLLHEDTLYYKAEVKAQNN